MRSIVRFIQKKPGEEAADSGNTKYVSLGLKGGRRIRLKILKKKDEPIKTGFIFPINTGPNIFLEEKPTDEIKNDGIAIPEIRTDMKEISPDAETEDESNLANIDIKYPLIPSNPKEGEKVYSYAHIHYDRRSNELVYDVVEPQIDEGSRMVLEEIKAYIQEKVDINFSEVRKKEAVDYVGGMFDRALDYFRARINPEMRDVIKYYILRDFIGLEKIEPLMNDKQIEDISCDGVNIDVYVYHRDARFGSLKTTIKFGSTEELDSFVNKLSERCGRVISVAKPLLDGTLPDGSRVQATLGSDIARRGSNFTIRMFTEKPLTPADMIKFGTCDLKMMAYYWLLVEYGSSVLISGGTATGKTSFLNVLSLFIKPQMKIVSIEDTAELSLPHMHWVPEVARTPIAEEGKVDMFELLRESLRQRPDYIIVGEVRGKEAYVLFQQMAVGHAGLSTIHAENFPKLVDRLTSPPINLPSNLLQNLDAIIFLKRLRKDRKYIRRVSSSVEVTGYDEKTKSPIFQEIFAWNPKSDGFKITNKSAILKKISDISGVDETGIKEEIEKRAKVIEWIISHDIRDYRKIAAIINLFYTSPDYLLERIETGI